MQPNTRILVIEDDPLILSSTRRCLEGAGYFFISAENGGDGLRLIREHKPHLVLLDVNLPDISGLDVCRQIKAAPELQGIFVILLSGLSTDDESKFIGLDVGADGYITRPISNRELLAHVQAMLRIQASEERYRSLFEHASEGVFIADQDGRYVDVNPSGCDMLGYTREEILNLSIKDLVAAEDQITTPLRLDQLRAGKVFQSERRMIRKDGSFLPVEISGKMLPDGRFQGMVRDISERKLAEEILKASEARFRSLIEQAPLAIALTRNGITLYSNSKFAALFGFCGIEETLGKAAVDYFAPSEKAASLERTQMRTRRLPTPSEIETVIVRKDGVEVPAHMSVATVQLADGDANLAILADISERKQAERALLASEERYRSLVQNMQIGVVVHAPDTSILFSNPTASHLLGLSMEQMQGKKAIDPAWSFIREDGTRLSLDEYPVNQTLASSHRFQNVVLGILRPDLVEPIWVQCDGHTVINTDGQIQQVIITFTDITERKLAEEAVQKSERLHSSVISSLSEGLVVQDKADKITMANESAARILGLTMDQLLGKDSYDPRWQALREDGIPFQPADHPSMITLRTGQPVNNTIMNVSIGDGRRAFISINSRPILDQTGQISGAIASFTDITERRLAEQALRENVERLSEILEATSGGVWDWNIPSGAAVFSEGYARMLGYTGEEFAKHYNEWGAIVHPDDIERVKQEHFDHFNKNKDFSIEYRMKEKSGNWHWIHSRGILIERDS